MRNQCSRQCPRYRPGTAPASHAYAFPAIPEGSPFARCHEIARLGCLANAARRGRWPRLAPSDRSRCVVVYSRLEGIIP